VITFLQRPLPLLGLDMNYTMVWVTTRCTVNPKIGKRHVRSVLRRGPTLLSSTPRTSPKSCSPCLYLWLRKRKQCGPSLASMTCILRGSISPSLVCDHFSSLPCDENFFQNGINLLVISGSTVVHKHTSS